VLVGVPTHDRRRVEHAHEVLGRLDPAEELFVPLDVVPRRPEDGEVVPGPGNGVVVPARRIRRDAGPTERVEQRVEIDVGAEGGGRRHQRDVRHQGLPGSTIGAG